MPASIKSADVKPDSAWLLPDALWTRIEPLLPPEKPKGRARKAAVPTPTGAARWTPSFLLRTWWRVMVTRPTFAAAARKRKDLKQILGFRARRGVVERTHSWMNRFRRLLIR